jgi:hypothetical protein
MTTRREATQALVEVVREFLRHELCHTPISLRTCDQIPELKKHLCALDACTEPDLDLVNLKEAYLALRAAMLPKPRWQVRNPRGSTVWELVDHKAESSWSLPFDVSLGTLEAVAALLNEKEKP